MPPMLLLLPIGLLFVATAGRRQRSRLTSGSSPVPSGPPFPSATGGYWQEVEAPPSGSFVLPYALLFALSAPASNPYTPQVIAWLEQLAGTGLVWQLQAYAPAAALPPDWPTTLDPPAAPAFRASGVVASPSGVTFTPNANFRTFVWRSEGVAA